ncbi:hypothetical protein [Acinetobacter calcoaceticus]
MGIIGLIVAGCVLWWLAHQHDKKMNENFMNFLIRFENIEQRNQELEIFNDNNEEEIKYLKEKVRELNERVYELEKPYQKSVFDDLD